MTKIVAEAKAKTGVSVTMTTTSPLNAAQEVADGTAQREYDAVWFASDAYFDLFPAAAKDLAGTTPIMSSPVILAVRTSVATRLGWENGTASWAQIAIAAGSGQFTFGMASPATADAGLSGLIAATAGAAPPTGTLGQGQVSGATPELTRLFHGQDLSAPDSPSLITEYRADLAHPGPGVPDGIIDYESDLIALKAEAPPGDPITLVYPSDGVVEADYPMSVLTTASPAARAAYQLLVTDLISPAVQQQIARTTHRRPVSGTHVASQLPAITNVLRPPSDPAVVKTLINVYLGQLRTPGRTVYVLDTSASMAGAGLAELKRALSALTEAGAGLAGKFSEFQAGEEVIFLPFSYRPQPPATFTVRSSDPGVALAAIRRYIGQLHAHGRTAIYDALVQAYQLLGTPSAKAPARIDSIVLITDGKDDWGRKVSAFLAYYRSLAAQGKPAPVYPIAVGDANVTELRKVATVTGGLFVNAEGKPLSALDSIVAAIRGYQ